MASNLVVIEVVDDGNSEIDNEAEKALFGAHVQHRPPSLARFPS